MYVLSTTITRSQVVDSLIRIEAERGDSVNPMNHAGVCLYTDPKDTNRHCIAGQIVFDVTGKVLQPDLRGIAAPGSAMDVELATLGVKVENDAWHLLRSAQELADQGPKLWRDVIRILRNAGVL